MVMLSPPPSPHPLRSTFWASLHLVSAITHQIATTTISVLQIRITLSSEWPECYETPSNTASPPKQPHVGLHMWWDRGAMPPQAPFFSGGITPPPLTPDRSWCRHGPPNLCQALMCGLDSIQLRHMTLFHPLLRPPLPHIKSFKMVKATQSSQGQS